MSRLMIHSGLNILIISPVAFLAWGCETAPTGPAPPIQYSSSGPTSDPGADAAFLHNLAAGQTVSMGDACRAMLMFLDGSDSAENYSERCERLRARKVIASNWQHAATSPIDKGTAAYMLVRVLGVRGGATLQLTGTSKRYALREMVYNGMMTRGGIHRYVTGEEFIGLLSRAEDFREAATK